MEAPTFSPVRECYQAQDGGDAGGGGRENDVFERIRRHLPPSARITLNKMFQAEMFFRIALKVNCLKSDALKTTSHTLKRWVG